MMTHMDDMPYWSCRADADAFLRHGPGRTTILRIRLPEAPVRNFHMPWHSWHHMLSSDPVSATSAFPLFKYLIRSLFFFYHASSSFFGSATLILIEKSVNVLTSWLQLVG